MHPFLKGELIILGQAVGLILLIGFLGIAAILWVNAP